MNAAEIKLDMFRKIDKLSLAELKNIYIKFLELIEKTSAYSLSEEERYAINEALRDNASTEKFHYNDIVNEAKTKYPNLKFK